MLRLFREGDLDGNGRIDCDEFITLGKKVDVFAGAAQAFTAKHQEVKSSRKRTERVLVRKGSNLGPRLTIDRTRHVFESTVHEKVENVVTMSNAGSTALYYE